MTATTLLGVQLSDTQTVAIVFGCIVVIALLKNRSVSGKLGTMSVTLDAVHTATNDRPKGTPTMSQELMLLTKAFGDHRGEVLDRLDQLDGRFTDLTQRLDALVGRVDVLEHPTDPPPLYDQEDTQP